MEHIGIDVEFLVSTTDFDGAVDGLNKRLKALKREVGQLNRQLKLDPSNIDKLNQKFKNLKAQETLALGILNKYQKNLKELEANGKYGTDEWNATVIAIEKSEAELANIQRQIAKIKDETDLLESGWYNVANGIEKAADTAGKLGDKLEPVSKLAQSGLKIAAESAIEFEDAFAEVHKTVEATDEQFAEINAGLRELSTRVPTSASDLATIAGLAGQMGVGADDVVAFTEAMVDFANSTNITAEQATQDIAQIYNVIGKGGNFDDLDNLLSTIVELGNNTATTEKDIVEMFKNISAGASRVGMTEAQMAALAATLSSLGLDKGGASAISKILTKIDMAVATNADSLEVWAEAANMSADAFKQAWSEDSAEVLLTIVSSMSDAVDEGGSLNAMLDELGVSELRQVDTMSRLINASGEYEKNIGLANGAYEDATALSEEAAKRYKTVASQLKILKNNFMEFAISIGDTLLPYINKFVEFLKGVAEWFNNLDPKVKDAIANTLLFVAALSPLLKGLSKGGTLLAGFIKKVVLFEMRTGTLTSIIKSLWGVVQPILSVISKFVVGHPLVAAITALIAILVWLYNTCEPFKEFVDNIIQKMKDLWTQFKQTNWIEKLGEKFGWLGKIIGGLIELVKGLLDWFGQLINKALEFLGLKSSIEGAALGLGGGHGSNTTVLFQSGGFDSSGAITLNANFTVNSQSVGRQDVKAWASWLADDLNAELGRRIR